jgi:hypothetical protein
MLYPVITAFVVATFSHGALSATLITDENMTANLNAGALALAIQYSPIWFFGQCMLSS